MLFFRAIISIYRSYILLHSLILILRINKSLLLHQLRLSVSTVFRSWYFLRIEVDIFHLLIQLSLICQQFRIYKHEQQIGNFVDLSFKLKFA